MSVVFTFGDGESVTPRGDVPIPAKGDHVLKGDKEYFVVYVTHKYGGYFDPWKYRHTNVFLQEIIHG